MRRLAEITIASMVLALTSIAPALATVPPGIPVPEPTTLSLLSGGIALGVLGARWLRRK